MNIKTGKVCHSSNYKHGRTSKIKYIVIHFTSNNGDTALNNVQYFANNSGISASAHFFVDENNIYTSVPVSDTAWHCGGTSVYKHPECRNANSIGIEMCSRINSSGRYYIKDETVSNAIELTKYLMDKYGIPASNVIRHYDVWDKDCPEPFVRNPELWTDFKERLVQPDKPVHYAQGFLDRLVGAGKIKNPEIWSDFGSFVTKAQALALVDTLTGGTWASEEADASIHWVQPIVISLCGKCIVSDKNTWLNAPDAYISKALCLALVDAATGGTKSQYVGRAVDHWARNNLDSLCDKAIVTTPHAWDDDFEGTVTRGNFLALVCKAFGI